MAEEQVGASGAKTERPAYLGLLECYYGPAWSTADRFHVLATSSRLGYTHYMLGLKDDRLHRDAWREPYRPHQLGQHAALVDEGRRLGMTVGFALSPGLDVRYGDAAEVRALINKFRAWQDLGARLFGLFFDDIPAGEDRSRFARLQAEMTTAVADALGPGDGSSHLIFCPTEYWGTASSPYWSTLARALPPGVEVFWTGPEIVSARIAARDVEAITAVLGRPLALWDNYPVNDEAMTLELHLGALSGREPQVARGVTSYWLNAMEMAHASLLPLATAADFVRDPEHYDAGESLARALRELVPDAALRAAIEVLIEVGNDSKVSGRASPVVHPGLAVDCARAAETLLASDAPLAVELRPWAHALARLADRLQGLPDAGPHASLRYPQRLAVENRVP